MIENEPVHENCYATTTVHLHFLDVGLTIYNELLYCFTLLKNYIPRVRPEFRFIFSRVG